MDVREQFGLTMQRLRRERSLSQEDLAGLTDIDRAYVGRLERGEANPTLLMMVRIAMALGVLLVDLVQSVTLPASAEDAPSLPRRGRRSKQP